MVENAVFPDCPIRNILARLCDKWSLLVIFTLDRSGEPTMRFKALQRAIPDISQKMLTVTLRTLEEDGYVTRTVYPEVPPSVEYALTERTRSLLPHIDALIGWALENKDAIMDDRRKATATPPYPLKGGNRPPARRVCRNRKEHGTYELDR